MSRAARCHKFSKTHSLVNKIWLAGTSNLVAMRIGDAITERISDIDASFDAAHFLMTFHDHLAPKLDTYEQALYLYIVRRSRLIGAREVTIGFKSARHRMATGVGESGKAMSEGTAYVKIASLERKGCLQVLQTTHAGRMIRVSLPDEIPGLVVSPQVEKAVDLEEMDFFNIAENRLLLLQRENFRCFYTLRKLDQSNFVVEHVVSRPLGNDSYRNCVAASREANNRKGSSSADDYLRRLYREGFLNEAEFAARQHALAQLRSGFLKPPIG